MNDRLCLLAAPLALAASLAAAPARAVAPPAGPAPDSPLPAAPGAQAPGGQAPGSLATTAPLGAGRVAMAIGGGVAVLLPFYALDLGVGLGRVDLVGRFESVIGVFHYPRVGVRWNPIDIGAWKIGVGLGANYSFFGIATDQLNLTSTFYLDAGAGISGPITPHTDLFLFANGEVDLFEHDVVDDDGETRGSFRYDATLFHLGIRTDLTEDLDGYLRGRLRIPTETFTYEATNFYVIPSIEIGGTWVF